MNKFRSQKTKRRSKSIKIKIVLTEFFEVVMAYVGLLCIMNSLPLGQTLSECHEFFITTMYIFLLKRRILSQFNSLRFTFIHTILKNDIENNIFIKFLIVCSRWKIIKNTTVNQGSPLNTLRCPTLIRVKTYLNKALYGQQSKKWLNAKEQDERTESWIDKLRGFT